MMLERNWGGIYYWKLDFRTFSGDGKTDMHEQALNINIDWMEVFDSFSVHLFDPIIIFRRHNMNIYLDLPSMLSYSTPFHSLKHGWIANELSRVGGQHRILSWVGWHPEKFVWKCDIKSFIVSPWPEVVLCQNLPKNRDAHDDTIAGQNLCDFQITFGYQGQWAGPKTGMSQFPLKQPLCKLSATGFKIKRAHNEAHNCFIFNVLSCVGSASCSSVEVFN